ncbi:MAG: M48 family metalloprotease [Deltaproteobacteria bacterium]|nr:M48 family metalloprotease [Deltaproteobacteria bacterium]
MNGASRREFLSAAGRLAAAGILLPSGLAFLSGCAESLGQVATNLLDPTRIDSLKKTYATVTKTFEDITPEQEYYIGRTIGAVILQKYKPYANEGANRYINLLGQSLAQASDLPETYGGYHFLIQDSEEINALAAPGGLVFITRGILRCCQSEDAVAAVLAHEVGHVQSKHGLQAIQKSRITSAITALGIEGAKTFGSSALADLTSTFEDSISDISKTLINSGYSRSFERQADQAAVKIMKRVGYDPQALVEMLMKMAKQLKPGGLDFAKTHPSPQSRIEDLQKEMGPYKQVSVPPVRQKRFQRQLASV